MFENVGGGRSPYRTCLRLFHVFFGEKLARLRRFRPATPVPDYYPHPDELNFTESKFVTGWRGLEPIQAAILRAHYIRMRDIFLLQAENDRRHFRSKCELDNVAGTFGLVIDALLPEMVQLDAVGLTIRLGKQRALRKRELHRRLATAWAEIGLVDAKQMTTFRIDDAAIQRLLVKLRQ